MPSKDQPAFPYDPEATPWNEADGIAWSETNTRDLIAALEHGDPIGDIANYLQYCESTVRAKMQELGLAFLTEFSSVSFLG